MAILLKSRNPRKSLNGLISTLYYMKAFKITYTEELNIPMVLPIKLLIVESICFNL